MILWNTILWNQREPFLSMEKLLNRELHGDFDTGYYRNILQRNGKTSLIHHNINNKPSNIAYTIIATKRCNIAYATVRSKVKNK